MMGSGECVLRRAIEEMETVNVRRSSLVAGEDVALERGDDGLLALPHDDDPQVLVLRDPVLGWVASGEAGSEPVEDGEVLTLGDGTWELSLPEVVGQTANAGDGLPTPATVSLELRVSADEEYVEVTVTGDGGSVLLPPRAHHYVLLTLARLRQRDAEAGEPESEQGWTYRDDLRQQLRMSANQLYVSIHRLKKEAEQSGLFGSAPLFDQRSTSRQVRLAVSAVHIAAL